MTTVPSSGNSKLPRAILAALPKIDLHRHLEGSLRLDTAVELARVSGLDLPALTPELLRPLVQVTDQQPRTFQNFLAKFEVLRTIYHSPIAIQRVAYEAVADAAADNVRYLELRFTPMALAKAGNFPLVEVTEWVLDATRRAAQDHGVVVRLIASMNRNESRAIGEEVARIASDYRGDGIVGLDLAGDEVNYAWEPFVGLFREAREARLGITVHAGEWTGAAMVRSAIESLDADRIRHGVRVMEDPAVVALARERAAVFEVCVTSNVQSGVVPHLADHPLPRMLTAGLRATINTDDPGVSAITLTDEFEAAVNDLHIAPAALKEAILSAASAAFLPQAERARLWENYSARRDGFGG